MTDYEHEVSDDEQARIASFLRWFAVGSLPGTGCTMLIELALERGWTNSAPVPHPDAVASSVGD